MAQAEPGFDFDIGQIVQVLVVFFLFVLPALRGILRSKAKQREDQERRGGAPAQPPGPRAAPRAAPKSLDDWEKLLRGEPVEPVEPVEPLDPGDLGDAPDPVEFEGLFPELDEEPLPEPTPVPVAVRPKPPAPGPPPPVRRQRAADLSMGTPEFASFESVLDSGGPRPRHSVGLGAGAGFASLKERTPAASGLSSEKVAAVDWRRAIVLAEVLGTPVSLRKEGAPPGSPVGLT